MEDHCVLCKVQCRYLQFWLIIILTKMYRGAKGSVAISDQDIFSLRISIFPCQYPPVFHIRPYLIRKPSGRIMGNVETTMLLCVFGSTGWKVSYCDVVVFSVAHRTVFFSDTVLAENRWQLVNSCLILRRYEIQYLGPELAVLSDVTRDYSSSRHIDAWC
jgi:hypothetical protein